MEYKNISQVAIRVNDIEKSIHFYCSDLGFEHIFNFYRSDGIPWMYYLRISSLNYLELIPVDKIEKSEYQSFHHLTLIVEDILKSAEELIAKGKCIFNGPAKFDRIIKNANEIVPGLCNSPAFYIVDPDGNDIEIMQFVPESKQLEFENIANKGR